MKQNFTVRQGALFGVEAFLGVAKHRSFRKAAADFGVTPGQTAHSPLSAAMHESGIGIFETCRWTLIMSAYRRKPEVVGAWSK